MDSLFKKISLIQFVYRIYFLFLLVFIIGFIYFVPSILYLSKIINSHYIPPKLMYGANVFSENKILNIGKLTSVYRGNFKRNGIYTDSLLPLNLKVLWRSFDLNGALHGASKSSPAVDDSGIYVGGDDGWFYAFNHDGSLRWKYYTFYNMRGIHSTAMLSEKYVWFGSYNGRLYCLNKLSAKVMWSLKVADAIGSSPLLYKDFIYVSVETEFLDAYVLKIKASNGKVVWRSPWLGGQIHSSVSLNPKQQLLYVGDNNGILFAIHMNEGRIFWSYDAKEPIKGTPLVDIEKNRVYFSSWNKKLTALNSQTGQLVWETFIQSASQSSPTKIPLSDVLVFSSHRKESSIQGIKQSTGELLWKKKLNYAVVGMHSGFSAKDKKGRWLYYGVCSKNNFCVLDPSTGQALKEIDIQGVLTGQPVPYKSFIYLNLNKGGLLKLGQ